MRMDRLPLLFEQLLDHALGLLIPAFAVTRVSDDAVFVDQMQCWPIPGAIAIPCGKIIIECHWIGDAQIGTRVFHLLHRPFPRELGRMDANDHKPFRTVLIVPTHQRWDRVTAIDSAVSPELEQNHFPAEIL